MTEYEYCEECGEGLVDYRLCSGCMDELTGSYEAEIKELEKQRDHLADLLQALTEAGEAMTFDKLTLLADAKEALQAISDGNGEDK